MDRLHFRKVINREIKTSCKEYWWEKGGREKNNIYIYNLFRVMQG